MFTGIIEEIGTVTSLRREGNVARLAIQAQAVREDLRIGDSLATNGVCLTVERIDPSHLLLTMMPETLKRTTLGQVRTGSQVNLERALRVDGRFGGHIVSGHVDGLGRLHRIAGSGEERVYSFAYPAELSRFIAPQGSIAIDGISLTVVDVSDERFSVSLIRHTLGATTLSRLSAGDDVNLEVDILARYLDRLSTGTSSSGGLTLARMRELGF